MADAVGDAVEKLWQRYKQLVSENPETVGQLEAGCRVLSYFIAGRFQDSGVLSELVYSASNILVMLNDAILQKAALLVPKMSVSRMKLMRLITVVEYLEVFVEMAALRLWGNTGRWIIIACIQIIRSAIRFFLLVEHSVGIQPTPPLKPFNRDLLKKYSKEQNHQKMGPDGKSARNPSVIFKLKRSGRCVRTLSAAPPISLRDWNLKKDISAEQNIDKEKSETEFESSPLNRQRTWAEGIYILRPVVHLFAMLCCGQKSWTPWLLSCGLDVSSLCLMGDPSDLNTDEKSEIKKRTFLLLFYLLRSPFFDRFSQARILILLHVIATHVPGSGLIIKPLMEYLPAWQRIYFYVWGT
ncbi:peroxisomal membrane protein PEX16-like [Liolophura sinensis]|uniref:peroxisomal membrane protein PEX16-like n=1 Tax=Liolophura sinensis TaxID=3198878 RepID=UPI003159312C